MLRDQLAEPNGEHRSGGHREHRGESRQVETQGEVQDRSALGILLENPNLTESLQRRHRHRQVISPLLLPLAAFTRVILHALLQSRDDRHQQLQDNLRRDVGVHTHGEHREVRHRATREQVEQSKQGLSLPGPAEHALDGGAVDARHRDMRCQPVDDQQHDGDQDPVPDIGRYEQKAPSRASHRVLLSVTAHTPLRLPTIRRCRRQLRSWPGHPWSHGEREPSTAPPPRPPQAGPPGVLCPAAHRPARGYPG